MESRGGYDIGKKHSYNIFERGKILKKDIFMLMWKNGLINEKNHAKP